MKKTTLNVLVKPNFEVSLYNSVQFPILRKFLSEIEYLYPNFDAWINFKFRRNLASGERQILVAHNSYEIVGAALLKKTKEENKICTFYISPEHRNRNIGRDLMGLALSTLNSDDVSITVSEERMVELSPLLASKGFTFEKKIPDLYRNGSSEYFYKL